MVGRLRPDRSRPLPATFAASGISLADGSGDPAAVKNEDGKYLDKEGTPTFKVQADGTVTDLKPIDPTALFKS